jgi:predicted kinase
VGVEPLPPNALTSGRRSNHPVLVAMSGRVASGKSTLARALSERLDAVRIVGDQVRDELLGDSREPVHEARWLRAFTPIFEEQGYAEMMRRADRDLATGRIVDACFPRNAHRLRARSIARRRGAAFALVECCALAPVVETRLVERDRTLRQTGWKSIHDELAARWEPVAELAPDECARGHQRGARLRGLCGARDTLSAKRRCRRRAWSVGCDRARTAAGRGDLRLLEHTPCSSRRTGRRPMRYEWTRSGEPRARPAAT